MTIGLRTEFASSERPGTMISAARLLEDCLIRLRFELCLFWVAELGISVDSLILCDLGIVVVSRFENCDSLSSLSTLSGGEEWDR